MTEYAIELRTIDGIADSDYLDRLAELVYELTELVDPLLALNENGSFSASFCVIGTDVREASLRALDAFGEALVQAGPHREPTDSEVRHGDAVVEDFAIKRAGDREKVYA